MKILNFKKFSSALVLIISISARAGDVPTPVASSAITPVDPIKIAAVMTLLKPSLLSLVKALSRPISLYSWTNRSSVHLPLQGNISASDPAYPSYVSATAKAFFHYTPRSQDMEGNGFYVAADPIATRRYGAHGDSWVLLAMRTHPNARFLDLTFPLDNSLVMSPGMSSFSFDAALITALNDAGCAASNVESILSSANHTTDGVVLANGQFANGKACQALRIAIATDPDLAISGVKYAYHSTQFTSCGRRAYAFNIWNAEAMFDFVESRGYSAGYSAGDQDLESRSVLSGFFRSEFAGEGLLAALGMAHLSSPYPELVNTTSSDAMRVFIKNNLMGCDSTYQVEDNTPFPPPIPSVTP